MTDRLEESSTAPQPSARRRLIRGAFSVPAVLTLSSGGALAAKSNTQCVAYQASHPSLPGVNGGDTWLRVQQYSKYIGAPYNKIIYFVNGADIVLLRGAKTTISVYIGSSQWQAVGDSTNNLYENSSFQGSPPQPDKGKFVAVRVDSVGNIIGIVGSNGSAGSAIAATCWMSFRAAP